jgi:hypothetical protein
MAATSLLIPNAALIAMSARLSKEKRPYWTLRLRRQGPSAAITN